VSWCFWATWINFAFVIGFWINIVKPAAESVDLTEEVSSAAVTAMMGVGGIVELAIISVMCLAAVTPSMIGMLMSIKIAL